MEGLSNHCAILHVLFRIEITCNTFRILRYSLPLSLHYDGIIYLCHNYEFKRQKIRDVDPSVAGKVLTILKRDLGIEPKWKWMWWWDATDRKGWESSFEYTHDDDICQKDDF
ncbi:hypothetical protein C8Q75DRAFT_756939 [Abortiporus biennis]|nr:hypothetical protein C8Q75DRAFT_756939 [Abortiporus biennis]